MIDASYNIPYGYKVILYRMVAGWYTWHAIGYRLIQVSHTTYYKEDIVSLFSHFNTHLAHIQVSIFSW